MTNIPERDRSPNAASAGVSRRSFFWKLGAGVSTALASTVTLARSGPGDANDLSLRVTLLEEEKTLRSFHRAFEQAMDNGLYDEVIDMFAEDAQVIFNGGVFEKRRQGISRLYHDHFRPAKAGKRMEQAPGFELDADQQQDSVEVSADRLSARARFTYSILAGVPVETASSLARMARLHGGGMRTWWEGGVYNIGYRRDTVDGHWTISQLEYNTLSRADYRPGRTYAMPITVAAIATTYPADPKGPDALVRAS